MTDTMTSQNTDLSSWDSLFHFFPPPQIIGGVIALM
jgi:hypothetical protein